MIIHYLLVFYFRMVSMLNLFKHVEGVCTYYYNGIRGQSNALLKANLGYIVILFCSPLFAKFLEIHPAIKFESFGDLVETGFFLWLFAFSCYLITGGVSRVIGYYMPCQLKTLSLEDIHFLNKELKSDIEWLDSKSELKFNLRVVSLSRIVAYFVPFSKTVMMSPVFNQNQSVSNGFVMLPLVNGQLQCKFTEALTARFGVINTLKYVIGHEVAHIFFRLGMHMEKLREVEWHYTDIDSSMEEAFADAWSLLTMRHELFFKDMINALIELRNNDNLSSHRTAPYLSVLFSDTDLISFWDNTSDYSHKRDYLEYRICTIYGYDT